MWARFTASFNYDRRPLQAIAFSVQPGLRNLPRDVVEAAIVAGKAERSSPPRKSEITDLQSRPSVAIYERSRRVR